MRKLKKLLVAVVTLVMVLGLAMTTYAEEQLTSVFDFETEFAKAINGISDIPVSELPDVGTFNLISSDGKIYEVPTYVTAKVITPRSATGTSTIAVTALADPRVAQSIPKELWDQTYGVRAYSTIYYDLKYFNGEAGYLLTRVSGGFQISDGQLGLLNINGNYGCFGTAPGGGATTGQQGTISFRGLTFDKSTGFTKYVTGDGDSDMLGCTISGTVRDSSNGQTWRLVLDNKLF